MKKRVFYLCIPAVLVLGIFSSCLGSPTYLTQYNAQYGTTASCSVCHTTAPALNAAGTNFKNSGHNLSTIAPASAGTTKPAAGAGTISASPPASAGSGVGQAPANTTQTNAAVSNLKPKQTTKTAKKNAAGSVTVPMSPSPKKNTNSPQSGRSNPGQAQKNSVIKGNTKTGTRIARMIQTVPGSSRRSGSVSEIGKGLPRSETLQGQVVSGAAQDMGIWTGKWFEMKMENKGYYMGKSGLSADRESVVRYLNISSWNPANKVLQGAVYEQGAEKGQWSSGPLSLHYISGSNLDFRFWSQVAGDSTYGFAGRIRGQEAGGILQNAELTTSGGYHLQVSGDSGSGGHWAGWLAISGNLTPDPGVTVLPTP